MDPNDSHSTDRPRAQRPLQDAPEPDDLPSTLAVRARTPAPPLEPRRRFRPAIETVLLASTAALLAAVAWPIATAGLNSPAAVTEPTPAAVNVAMPTTPVTPAVAPKIQIALLLDTSGSMDGLIDQARSQLWRVVNALDSATFQGATPQLEIALYEYGNDGIDGDRGYIRQVSAFTAELDLVSEALFSLTTLGGEEYTGQAIARSVDELAWADGPGTLKVVYVAGNESFSQGPVAWESAIGAAREKGIVVNTVLCDGADDHWSAAALAGGGKFMQIDHDAVAEYVAAPQDDAIARIGRKLNDTYIAYGDRGRLGFGNQAAQDNNMQGYGQGSVVQRAIAKGSRNYVNPAWDLVDAMAGDSFDVETIDPATLPAELRGLSATEIASVVDGKRKTRNGLQAKLKHLSRQRDVFVAAAQSGDGGGAQRLDTAIVASIVAQAQAAGFTIDNA